MITHHRPFVYESSDFKLMCELVVKDNATKKDCFVWHIARLVDWKYNLFNPKSHFPGYFSNAAHLWFNYYDKLIGFVISEGFDDQFEILVLEEYDYLYPEMLSWVNSIWGKQYQELNTSVVESQLSRISALELAGYKRTDDVEKIRIFDTSVFSQYPIPTSPLRFESMDVNKDYKNQGLLRKSAWPHDKIDPETDESIRAYVRTSPIYNARFDFVLVGPSGAHVSGCEAFIDRFNKTAELERVCTHADHSGKGYAQITLQSCMRVLHDNNIPIAYLTGWNDKTIHLYGKLGHINEFSRYSYCFTKDNNIS
jgi:GNAT superfamily N-acetyltransferase